MKANILSCVCIALVLSAKAQDSDYQTNLKETRERLETLEIQRDDYRKMKPQLPPAQEAERYRLLGQLFSDDPIWALMQQLQVDIEALTVTRKEVPGSNLAVLETLKDLLALTSTFEGRATTRPEADTFATALRQFIARRDVSGAEVWARKQRAE